MDRNMQRYLRYKNCLKFLQQSAGIWSDREAQPWAIQMFFRFFSGFILVFGNLGTICFLIFEANNIYLFLKGFAFLIAFSAAFIKLCILAIFQSDLEYLDRNVSSFFEADLKDCKKQKNAMKHFPIISNIFWAIFMTVTILNITFVFMAVVLSQGNYVKLYPLRWPIEIGTGETPIWISFIFQGCLTYYYISVGLGGDSIFGYYCLHLIGQLAILRQEYLNLKFTDNYHEDLKSCVQRHHMIQKTLPILEKIFGFLSIWLALTCAIVICAQAWQVSKLQTISVGKGIYIVMYLSIKFLQSFSYAYYGYAITSESEKCLQAVYESQWAESGSKQFMKDVLIIISQKPMVFNAMGFMNLGFDMFLKTCNTSLSYYMLLRTVEAK